MIGRRFLVAAGALIAVAVPAACGRDDGGSDAERFCGEIGLDPAAIVAPPLGSDEELDQTLTRYRELADLAPVAIEAEWRTVLLSLETATTVVPDDPTSVQRAVSQAYASERSAVAVRDWLLANCAIDLGPVATITPHGPAGAPPVSDADPAPTTDD